MTKPTRAFGHRLAAPGREVRRWVRRWGGGLRPAASAVSLAVGRVPAADRAAGIRLLDVRELASFRHDDPGGVLVIMPSIRVRKGVRAARTLIERAGMPCTVLVARDSLRQGFVATCNGVVGKAAAKYVVYLAEDAFPGLDWLRLAHDALERSGKGLLGFNDGKWRGRIAAFGMVRLDWVRPIYGGPLFYPGYVAHKADNELTVIARAQDQYVYEPECMLVENDPKKVFRDSVAADPATFRNRFRSGFEGLVPLEKLAPLAREYFVPWPAGSVPPGAADALTNFNSAILKADRRRHAQGDHEALTRVVRRLLEDGEAALGRGLYSVTDKTSLPPSGDPHDYWHPAPYWWPNPGTADGLPYVNRDGVRAAGTRLYEPESERYDRSRLQRVFDDTLVLALAWRFSGAEKYAARGAEILERFFVDPRTRMNAHLAYAQVRMGHNGNLGTSAGIIEMKDLYYYLDAVRMLIAAGALRRETIDGFSEWLSAYLRWLLTSAQGRGEERAANNHGIYFDLQVASIAAFLDEQAVVQDSLRRACGRIGQHFAADGSQPAELRRNLSAHYCCFNLQGWINLARLAAGQGLDLWAERAANGAGLRQGAEWLLSHAGRDWAYEQIEDFDSERLAPIRFAMPGGIPAVPAAGGLPVSRFDAKPVFHPHDGIRPYWNLGN